MVSGTLSVYGTLEYPFCENNVQFKLPIQEY